MTRVLRVIVIACAFAGASACDPVRDRSVDALGDEVPGIQRGPLHRAGQPCLTCHDGTAAPPFTLAGTVYLDADRLAPADGATVTVTSADGVRTAMTTNQVGNFYVSAREVTPVFPLRVKVAFRGVEAEMTSLIGRDGSCADCHTDPPGPSSAGHVFVPADGKTP